AGGSDPAIRSGSRQTTSAWEHARQKCRLSTILVAEPWATNAAGRAGLVLDHRRRGHFHPQDLRQLLVLAADRLVDRRLAVVGAGGHLGPVLDEEIHEILP